MITEIYENYIKTNSGLCFILLGNLFNSFMVFFCKLLLLDKDFDPPIHPLHILAIRMFITYICCSYFLWEDPNFPFGPKGYRIYMILRGLGGFVGVAGQYFALMYLSVSDTVVMSFLAPTVTSWMAYVFLGEPYTRLEAICGATAFLGVVLVARPSFIFYGHDTNSDEDAPDGNQVIESSSATLRLIGTCAILLSCFGTGVSMCSMRKIGFHAHPLLTVSIFALITFILSSAGAIIFQLPLQIPHTLNQWLLLSTVGIAGFVMQYLSTMGMQREKAARAMSMSYTQLLYTTVLEYVLFNHLPSPLTILGSSIIIGSVMIIILYKPEEDDDENLDTELSLYEDTNSINSSDSDK
ncbi:hypothetical protein KL918_000833 [Ogataea parapolymorpha]|uniref:Transport protein n=1 Tax=Ogataea parapolymorpha (strain ATCC 26012 / BCRC 20466 / JCM 22074 / NRRL Y-7560 / DL-1) TaxID=871575 RepID=W1Q8R8_OGAPD|nr:transport protein [Ogataea parapolymorpha DL-1]ESW97225.1 transport protein [Ogataea parapolymorpha DL-1]KAG7869288.1 hypothetical protein KL918_000833 [Ogataea parapolymorpha]KAG7875660.1 hypothetical protein KL916_000331 [Ogataea parapolymorpha]